MSAITADMVKKLREMSGAGMMDCKSALTESNGSMEGAIEVLRKKGLKALDKRAGKVAAEGVVATYTHPGDQVVAIVELNCETDFVARGDDFKAAAKGIALHVAAMKPRFLNRTEVSEAELENEKNIFLAQLTEAQRKNADKILPGKLEKFYEENCLVDQIYVKDDSGKATITSILNELSMKTGEKVVVKRFIRFEVGEGVEKPQTNLADDVAELTQSVSA